jgi:hypothetical protein
LKGWRLLVGELHLLSGLLQAMLALHLPPGEENEDDEQAEDQNRCKCGKADSAAQARPLDFCAMG